VNPHFPDFLIIGGGVVGLALARRLKQKFSDSQITLLEKEPEVAQHASGRNSGVLHAGFYYASNSLKARLCVEGNRAMKRYCLEQDLPLNTCGKLVVTRSVEENPELEKLYQRGLDNGVRLERLTPEEAQEREPNAKSQGLALFSPDTATVNPNLVCQTLKRELLANGVQISLDTQYLFRREKKIHTNQGIYQPGFVINAAGLYADKIAQDFGFGQQYTLLPFKGIYLGYSGSDTVLQTHIYPVPDPRQPFLGVHFTKTVDGHVKIGPTAIPALWRENYQGLKNINLAETFEILWYESQLFIQNSFGFRDLALSEIRKYNPSYFAKLAKNLVKEIDTRQFKHFLKPGIRAQLLNIQSLELVQDFVIEGDQDSLHILNAVSPAFTCALSFADYICENGLIKKI
jgi:L-2-hydroxyglutarate oxidase